MHHHVFQENKLANLKKKYLETMKLNLKKWNAATLINIEMYCGITVKFASSYDKKLLRFQS